MLMGLPKICPKISPNYSNEFFACNRGYGITRPSNEWHSTAYMFLILRYFAELSRFQGLLHKVVEDRPRAGLTIRGAPYQRKAGALFSYAKPGFSYLWRCTFSQKSWRPFLVLVTFKRTLNVQTAKQRGKKLAADRRGRGAPWRRGPLPWYNRHNG